MSTSSPNDALIREVEDAFASGLTLEGGFLPRAIPPRYLPPPFDDYARAATELPPRYHGNQRGLRSWLDALFPIAPENLEANLDQLSEAQRDRLFSAISVLAHAYRWNTAPPHKEEYARVKIVLPPGLAAPWASLARRLDVPRVGNLYSMVLCNFHLRARPEGGAFRNDEIVADNVEIAHTWLVEPESVELRSFLLAPIETEARGALAVRTSVELLRAVTANDPHQVIYLLDRLRAEIQAMGLPFREFIQKKTIKPDHFLTLIQPTTIWGLDEGDGHGPLEGASGPQVGCIQVIDALLGTKRESPMAKAISRSRDYMPARHRRFVRTIEAATRLLPEFIATQKHRQMSDLFNECLEGMEAWRRVHQVRGAIFLKGDTVDPNRSYMSTGGVVALEDERIARFKASMEERVSETLAALLPEVPLAPETGLAVSFQYLTPEDRDALMAGAQRSEFPAGTVIVSEGLRRAGLYLLQAGSVRVVRKGGRDIILARLAAGGLFGEMSFLENETTSASIEAEGNCVLDLIPREHVFTLCREREGFAARFYQSLATLLSRRLASTSQLASELLTQEKPRSYRGRPQRAAGSSVPDRAVDFARTFRREVEQCGGDEARLTAALNSVLQFVQADAAEFKAQWPDAADHLFKEKFPVLMRSALAQHLYHRPQGRACSACTMQMLHAAPAGDDTTGIAVDAWLRRLPTLCALAKNHETLIKLLSEELQAIGAKPAKVLSLGAAPVAFLCETLTKFENTSAVALEWDAEDAAAAREQAIATNVGQRLSITHDHIIRMARQRQRQSAAEYQIVVADQLFHFASDDEAMVICNWVQKQLAPGGVFIFSSLEPETSDRAFLECLTDWAPERRPADEIRRLIAESSFRKAAVSITEHETLRSVIVRNT